MKRKLHLTGGNRPSEWYGAETISKLLADAELKDKMAQTTSSKNWLALIRVVAKLITENIDLKIALRELQYENLNHDLHLEALESKVSSGTRA